MAPYTKLSVVDLGDKDPNGLPAIESQFGSINLTFTLQELTVDDVIENVIRCINLMIWSW